MTTFYEKWLLPLADEQLTLESDTCTLKEAHWYRQRLHDIGPEKLVNTTIEAGIITARKFITAFRVKVHPRFEDREDEEYYPLISIALRLELEKRPKLPNFNTVDDAVCLIKNAKYIIVLTGAGISTSLGIPDFRSPDTGLYNKLQYLGLNDPQEVFNITLFREDPSYFYEVARDILSTTTTTRCTPTHAFIKLLQDKGKLLTNYTQNIDNIEAIAGIDPAKLIQCHGSFATATCVQCQYQVPGATIFADISNKIIPRCEHCIQRLRNASATMKRKQSYTGREKKRRRNGCDSTDDEYDIPEAGVMKPDITFFGESLPPAFENRLAQDKNLADLVIVIGTSLKVAPVKNIVPFLGKIPQLYISREAADHVNFDIDLLGDCDVVVSELCRRLGWELKHEMLPEGQRVHVQTMGEWKSRHTFSVLKSEQSS